MMKLDVKRIGALALAVCFSFGAAAVVMPDTLRPVSAHERHYEDGSSNAYSHRMKEEQQRHDSTVRTIRHEYRQDGDERKYHKRMKEEQERHDRAVREIRHDYDRHSSHNQHY